MDGVKMLLRQRDEQEQRAQRAEQRATQMQQLLECMTNAMVQTMELAQSALREVSELRQRVSDLEIARRGAQPDPWDLKREAESA